MTSNCYILWDEESRRCVVIDPASEKSLREIAFIKEVGFSLDYILLTHEHTDHNWGVNALVDEYPKAKVVCHRVCAENMGMESTVYFRLYYDNPSYSYSVKQVDIKLENEISYLDWDKKTLVIEHTPGHSMGSVCIVLDDKIFTGDTIMPFKPYINKRNGLKDCYIKSVAYMHDKYADKGMTIYPGHGDRYIYE